MSVICQKSDAAGPHEAYLYMQVHADHTASILIVPSPNEMCDGDLPQYHSWTGPLTRVIKYLDESGKQSFGHNSVAAYVEQQLLKGNADVHESLFEALNQIGFEEIKAVHNSLIEHKEHAKKKRYNPWLDPRQLTLPTIKRNGGQLAIIMRKQESDSYYEKFKGEAEKNEPGR
jgi:hypothetical protein